MALNDGSQDEKEVSAYLDEKLSVSDESNYPTVRTTEPKPKWMSGNR